MTQEIVCDNCLDYMTSEQKPHKAIVRLICQSPGGTDYFDKFFCADCLQNMEIGTGKIYEIGGYFYPELDNMSKPVVPKLLKAAIKAQAAITAHLGSTDPLLRSQLGKALTALASAINTVQATDRYRKNGK